MKRSLMVGLAASLMTSVAIAQTTQPRGGLTEQQGRETQAGRAQESRQNQAAGRQGAPSQMMTEEKIATLLAISARECAELSQMAAEKASNEQVKSFAQQRAQASQKMLQQLSKYTGESAEVAGADRSRGNQNRLQTSPGRDVAQAQRSSASNQADRTVQPERREIEAEQPASQRQGSQQFNLLDAKRNIAEEARKLVQEEMEKKSGEEFDMAYIGSEIVGLTSAIACLEVSQRYVGSELSETLKNAQEEARSARDKAEEIAKTLSKSHESGDRSNP